MFGVLPAKSGGIGCLIFFTTDYTDEHGYWMLDAGWSVLDAGYWMVGVGCWILDGRCWMLGAG